MADIASARSKLNTDEVAQDKPMTEALHTKIGADINYLIDERDVADQRLDVAEADIANLEAADTSLQAQVTAAQNDIDGAQTVPIMKVSNFTQIGTGLIQGTDFGSASVSGSDYVFATLLKDSHGSFGSAVINRWYVSVQYYDLTFTNPPTNTIRQGNTILFLDTGVTNAYDVGHCDCLVDTPSQELIIRLRFMNQGFVIP